jgi:hypothetical protein
VEYYGLAVFLFSGFTDLPKSGYQPDLDAPPSIAASPY